MNIQHMTGTLFIPFKLFSFTTNGQGKSFRYCIIWMGRLTSCVLISPKEVAYVAHGDGPGEDPFIFC